MNIVIIGLSITSSWGNGHATTFRALARELSAQGHRVVFLERDVSWYAQHRDLPNPPYARVHLYRDLDGLRRGHARLVAAADAVIVGSYVPEGIAVGEWVQATARGVTAFYDIDTPVTLAALDRGECSYLEMRLIRNYDLYLSFTGGPTLARLQREFGARLARALYCSFDPRHYYPETVDETWDLGYLGTWSADRQPRVDRLLLEPARQRPERRFTVAGAMYPDSIDWPANVELCQHIPPHEHRGFYNRQRFTLNVTRDDMRSAGWSPSVRLFEAAACGTPIISDTWPGLDELFEPGREILLAETSEDVLGYVEGLSEGQRRAIGRHARERVMDRHTAAHRAAELTHWLMEASETNAASAA
ncbi:MAG TPA: glycosyltransferase [Rhodanobacteraceae bacterium]|nr:glycosyltransferase [Rhodanobacteraceae bacterium]